MGVAALLLLSVYIFNGKESASLEKPASVAEHKPVETALFLDETAPDSTTQNSQKNEDTVAVGSQEFEDSTSAEKPASSVNIGPDSQPKQAESDSFDSPSEKTPTDASKGSMSSHATNDMSKSAKVPSRNTALESTHQDHVADKSPLSEDNFAVASRPEDNGSTSVAKEMKSEAISLSENQSESIQIESTGSPSPHIARAQFTSGIEAREPIDRIEKIFHSEGNNIKRLYYFTELRNMKGDSVIHRWDHQGKTVANITFNIGGDRWRVYSSKNLPSSLKGRWEVVVTDLSGKPLASESFIYD